MRYLLLCLLLAGCTSATLVQPPAEHATGQQAPAGGTADLGVVSYLDEGPEFVREARREEALVKMEAACAGKTYRIVEEKTVETREATVYGGYGAAYVPPLVSAYRTLHFECFEE